MATHLLSVGFCAILLLFAPTCRAGGKFSTDVKTELKKPLSVCEENETCVPFSDCTALLREGAEPCRISGSGSDNFGYCCPTRLATRSVAKRAILQDDFEHVSSNALLEGRRQFAEKWQNVIEHGKSMTSSSKTRPDFHQLLQPSEADMVQEALAHHHDIDLDRVPYEAVYASKAFADALNWTVEERQHTETFANLPRNRSRRCLPPADSCNPQARFRSFDGSCNNPHPDRTRWGAAGHPFEKLLPPAYEDGVWAPRIHSVTGRKLASARTISAHLLHDLDRPHHHLNLLLMQFGQFIAHDFTRSSSIKIGDEAIECCSADSSRTLRGHESHFACLPIEVSPHDPFYSKFGVRCLNFVRLSLAAEGHCRLGYAKQLSKVTHFIDGSTVYGSEERHAASLRSFHRGQLKDSFPVGIELLPPNRDPSVCEPWAKVCFEAGDDRVNQIVSLVQVHVLFLREHNRLAKVLSHVNPHWDDERLYQEARKIVIAEIQHILYHEYLPLVIGWEKVKQYGLLDDDYGHTQHYSHKVKPVVLAEVSGAAFRFGHSTVEGHFRIHHRHQHTETVPIHKVFDDPSRVLHPTSFDDYIYSLGKQSQQEVDPSVTLGLTGFLFAGRSPFGTDLASLNIQRGRDHALRPYNDYRSWLGLHRIHSFHQFGPSGAKLAQVYESPDDVDLWIGGLLEPVHSDGIVGETFGHLIGEQFARLKFGDRYFYTEGPKTNPGAFTAGQLDQIRKVSLASIICANVDKRYDFYQAPNAFLKSSHTNEPIPCPHHRDIDFGHWRHQH
ncbi:chorion peroxidase-like isoform X2 [Uranotaenia lowii]|uniref:chorion peroxidase-like isoform X2 n=1 Tax=Uranotaenia lowii TaxID=190385 RepID=UPI00247B1372|nr:chorion peroxidase-like isoform X2 [Uranotaenia lowii]